MNFIQTLQDKSSEEAKAAIIEELNSRAIEVLQNMKDELDTTGDE